VKIIAAMSSNVPVIIVGLSVLVLVTFLLIVSDNHAYLQTLYSLTSLKRPPHSRTTVSDREYSFSRSLWRASVGSWPRGYWVRMTWYRKSRGQLA